MTCSGGRLCFKVWSASKASLVHVRAMSFRMACTRGFGAPSASLSHSAARSLQSSEFNCLPSPTERPGQSPDWPEPVKWKSEADPETGSDSPFAL